MFGLPNPTRDEEFAAFVRTATPSLSWTAFLLTGGMDADVLVAAGHRVRRARLLKRSAAAGALVVASAVLGWAGINTAATRFSDPVVVGNPALTPSTAAALVPANSGEVVFPEGDAGSPNAKGIKSVKVEALVLDDGSYSVEFTAITTAGETLSERSTAGAEEVIWFQPSLILIVGFVPHRFEWIQFDLPDSHATGRFYVDNDLGRIGLDEDGSVGTRKLGSAEVYEFLGWAAEDGGPATGGLVLPVGAHDPVLTTSGTGLEWAQARVKVAWQSLPLPACRTSPTRW